jgi:hypothetical protein
MEANEASRTSHEDAHLTAIINETDSFLWR